MGRCSSNLATLSLLTLASSSLMCAQPQGPRPAVVSVRELAAEPQKFLGRSIRVSGTLENEGKNYFTDLRVVIKDKEGRKIHVRPWLPMSLPPRPPSAEGTGKQPVLLSHYLGKEIELTAVIRKGPLRHAGDVYHLEVSEARVK